MKKFASLLLILLLSACSDDDSKTPAIYEYNIYPGKQLSVQGYEQAPGDTIYNEQIIDGNRLVFEYRYTAPQWNNAFDDEYTETVLFEIDNNINSFELIDAKLNDLQVLAKRMCFCPDFGGYLIDEGKIAGEKISAESWIVVFSGLKFKSTYDDQIVYEINGGGIFTTK